LRGGSLVYASLVRVPTDLKSAYGTLLGAEEMSVGFQKQGFWNAVAAAITGLAVLLDLASRAFPAN
jgi:hypothetical protein